MQRMRITMIGHPGIGKTAITREAIIPWLKAHDFVPIDMEATTEAAASNIELDSGKTCRIYHKQR